MFGSYILMRECPHLNNGLCKIYEDRLRPQGCHDYPMYLDSPFGMAFLRPLIIVEMSCSIFRYEKNRIEAEELAEGLGLEIVFRPDYEDE